jgi:O-antigen ligase
MLIPGSYWERIASVTNTTTDRSIGRRSSYLIVAQEVFSERPLIGTGLLTFADHFSMSGHSAHFASSLSNYYRPAHNTYVEVLIGTGMIGLFLFLAIIVITLRSFTTAAKIFRESGREELAEIAWAYRTAMLILLVFLLFISDYQHKFFWLSVALSQLSLHYALNSSSGNSVPGPWFTGASTAGAELPSAKGFSKR